MYVKLNVLVLHVVMFFLLGSCIEEIPPIEQARTWEGGDLMIYGQITTHPGPHKIRVARTSARERYSEPVLGARVQVHDDLGNAEYCRGDEEGNYWLSGFGIKGEVGRTYHLEVTLPDGNSYRSQPETLHPLTGKDSAYFTFSSSGGIQYSLNVWVDSELQPPTSPFFLRWTVEECFLLSPTDFPDPFNSIPPPCYVTQPVNPDRVNLLDGRLVQTTFSKGNKVASRPIDYTFKERHYTYVVIRSLSEEAFAYWEKVGKVTQGTGSLFTAPPAPIPGNIISTTDAEEKVLGFFEANAVDTAFFYTLPDDIPTDLLPYCEYDPARSYSSYAPECRNCMLLEGSSREKPYFFGR